LFFVIPIQYDAAVEITCPILGEYIFDFDCRNEIINVLFWSVFAFVIAVWGKTFPQELVGKDSGLGETSDSLAHLEVDVSSNDFGIEVILVDDPLRKEIDGHFHVLITVESCPKVEVANVKAHVLHF
jgi:hypothetical protein